MQLTEEQRKAIEAAATEIEYMHADLMGRGGFSSDGKANPNAQALRALLAAYSAGEQGEPVGELVIGECKNGYSAPWLFRLFDGVQAKDGMQLYAQPQPMTDAARDARRYQWLRAQHEMQTEFEDAEGFVVREAVASAWTVFRPGCTTSLEPVGCIPGELDKAIDAALQAEKETRS